MTIRAVYGKIKFNYYAYTIKYGVISLKKFVRKIISAAAAVCAAIALCVPVSSDSVSETATSLKKDLTDIRGQYPHWDGISPVTQFKYYDGTFCIAIDNDDSITVLKISPEGNILPGVINLEKPHKEFGTVISDDNGFFYAVTGETNSLDGNRKQATIFISKYLRTGGAPMWTASDDGSSSLQYYHDDGHNTRLPFDSGIDAAISGNILAVNYGRFMYNGHQANSIWAININTAINTRDVKWISTHSFAHRAIPVDGGFVFVSEGDCYERAFSIYAVKTGSYSVMDYNYGDPFHFWVRKNALKDKAYGVLNNNFAHLAGIVPLSNGNVALVGTAAPSLDENAANEKEKLFIQIFDPFKDLSKASSYVTEGTRSGLSGGNGDLKVTDYGVKWLDEYMGTTGATIENPQVTVTNDDRIVILYEKGDRYPWTVGWHYKRYDGLFYMVLDAAGNVIREETQFSATARLDPCEMPVYTNGSIYWVGNTVSDRENIYINILTLDGSAERDEGIKGDVDGDGKISYHDATVLLAYLEGSGSVSINKNTADVNGDGSVDRKDAELIQRYAAGNTDIF